MKQTYKYLSGQTDNEIWTDLEDTKLKPLLSETESTHDSDELTKQLGSFKVKSNIWVLWGILGAITGSIGSFYVGKASISTSGFYARTMISIGNLIAGICYFWGKMVINKLMNPQWRQPEYISEITNKQKFFTFCTIFVDAVLSIGGGFLVVLTFEYAYMAGINQGIITTLFSFTSVFLSLFGWMIFKEKINSFQIGGMLLLTTSAILYGFSGSSSQDNINEGIKPIIPIIFALLSTTYFMLRSLALKAFWVRYEFSALDLMSLSYIMWGILLSIPLFFYIYWYGIDIESLKYWVIGGVLQETSMILMYYSISTGYSGPAAALSSFQAPIQTMLAVVFLSQYPDSLQIYGLIFAMTGSILISLSSSLVGLLNK